MTLRVAPLPLAGLLALVCLDGWLLVLALRDPVPDPEVQIPIATSALPPGPPASNVRRPKSRPISAYGRTLASPVFFKSRAPYVPPPPPPPPRPKPVAKPPPVPTDPGLVLGGVAIMPEARKAYIFKKADSRGRWVREGETFLGWRVQSIDAENAMLQQGGRTIELQLYPKGQGM